MQNRFKFRVWNTNSDSKINKMVYLNEPDDIRFDYKLPDLKSLKDSYILMQCTGLKDKNGKLVYEGDVCEFSVRANRKGEKEIKNIKGEVEYRGGSYNFGGYAALFTFDVEVIGNKYKNPELLK